MRLIADVEPRWRYSRHEGRRWRYWRDGSRVEVERRNGKWRPLTGRTRRKMAEILLQGEVGA